MQAHYNDGTCANLAGKASIGNKWEMLNGLNPEEGLKITLNQGSSGGVNYTVEIDLQCDLNRTLGNFEILNQDQINPRSTNINIVAKSKDGKLNNLT